MTYLLSTKRLFSLSAAIVCYLCSTTLLAEVHVYRNHHGQLLFSDTKIDRTGFTYIRSLGSLAYAPPSLTDQYKSSSSKNRDRYDRYILQAANYHGVNPALVKAVIHAESAFNRTAVSRVGAQGLMQLMPKTAAHYDVSDPYNPRQNIYAGTKHLKFLMGLFKNDMELVLAAYNAGQANVYKYDGIPFFKETQNYVVKVKKLFDKYSGKI